MVIGAWKNEILVFSGQQKSWLAKANWVKLRLYNGFIKLLAKEE